MNNSNEKRSIKPTDKLGGNIISGKRNYSN